MGLLATTATIAEDAASSVTQYKNPQCGCCDNFADYLRDNGFTETVKPTSDLDTMSRKAGIPNELQGCHLAFIDDYFVSGHVPLKTVNRMLRERPDINGITLPGMPAGSPGMSGSKTSPFTIYQIEEGATKTYAVE
jgi:hypothetical protein